MDILLGSGFLSGDIGMGIGMGMGSVDFFGNGWGGIVWFKGGVGI